MRILITSGPTREHFDSVRFISNASSGKMGRALAQAALRRGHSVVFVTGPAAVDPPRGVEAIRVTSAAKMLAACRRAFPSCDAAIFAAAVCDYRPVRRAMRKPAKRKGRWSLELEPTADIAATLGRRKGRRISICFALEDHNGRAHARRKLERKNADAVVLNSPGQIAAEGGKIDVLYRNGLWQDWGAPAKRQVAIRLVCALEGLARTPSTVKLRGGVHIGTPRGSGGPNASNSQIRSRRNAKHPRSPLSK